MGFFECTKSKENSDLILKITITEYLSGYKAVSECKCTVLEANTGFTASSSPVYHSYKRHGVCLVASPGGSKSDCKPFGHSTV